MATLSSIPESWKRHVCNALDSGDTSRIIVTLRAKQDWQNAFPHAFMYMLYVALSDVLKERQVEGVLKEMKGAEESYAFFFVYEKRKMYAKVGLRDNKFVTVVFSAHVPLKGERL